jgi:WD40 repeat protein
VASIFISHSSRDNQLAAEIKAWLVGQGYENVFLDFDKQTGLGAGREWERQLYEAIGRCHAVLLIVTSAWMESKWCFAEFTQARALGKEIFPLVATPDDRKLIGPTLRTIQAALWGEAGKEHLARRLKEVADEIARGHRWDPARPPWPGILSFEAEDAAVFFGRDPEIRKIGELLEARRAQGGVRLLLIVGASGSGKSSVLKAGVLPYLARDRQRFLALPPFRPGRTPVMALAKVVAEALGRPGDFQAIRSELGGAEPGLALAGAVEALTVGPAREATVLLPIDQFEEIFTIAVGPERDTFLRLLLAAADQERALPIVVVATIRSDLLGEILKAEGFTLAHEVFTLGSLPSERLASVIEGPAEVAAINLENGLVARILEDVGPAPEALPLLAFTLRELQQRHGGDKKLTLLEYEELGDAERGLRPLENAVRRAAEETLAAATPSSEELTALRETFIGHLVRLNEGGVRLRRPARMQDIPPPARRLVERLVAARLLSIRSEGSDNTIEVAHEALFKAWPQLGGWLDEEQDFFIGRRQIEDAERLWATTAEAEKDKALLSGLLLEKARQWSLSHPERLKSVRDFVASSIRKSDLEQARARRRQRMLLAASLAAALVFAVLGGVALLQSGIAKRETDRAEEQARIADVQKGRAEQETQRAEEQARIAADNAAGALAALSTIELEKENIVDAAKLALAAWPRSTTSRGVQLDAVIGNLSKVAPELLERTWLEQDVNDAFQAAAFSTDARRFALVTRDRRLLLRDVATERTSPHHQVFPYTNSFAFSPDGSKFVASSPDNAARLWTGPAESEPAKVEASGGPVPAVAFLADGSLVTASLQGTVTIWNADDPSRPMGQFLAEMARSGDELWHLAVSPDGGVIVTGSRHGEVRFWDAGTGDRIGELPDKWDMLSGQDSSKEMAGLGYSPDGTVFFAIQRDGSSPDFDLALWNTTPAKSTSRRGSAPTLSVAAGNPPIVLLRRTSFAFSRLGHLAVGDRNGDLLIHDTREGLPDPRAAVSGFVHAAAVTSIAFSLDGKRLLTGDLGGVAKLWALAPMSEIAQFDRKGASVAAVAFQDGERIAIGYGDGEVRSFRIEEDALVIWRSIGGQDPLATAVSPNGSHVAVLSQDFVAQVHDAATGAEVASLSLPDIQINALAVSSDGAMLAVATDDKVQVWDLAKRSTKPIFERKVAPDGVEFPSTGVLVFSNDGTRLAAGGTFLRMAGFFSVWDVPAGAVLQSSSNRSSGQVNSIAFSPDGASFLVQSQLGGLRWLDTSTPASSEPEAESGLLGEREPLRDTDNVQEIALSPDGSRAVGLESGVVRLWDATTGAAIARFEATNPPTQVVFGPRPDTLVSVSRSGSVGLWNLSEVPDGDLFEVVCALLPDHDFPSAGTLKIEQPICGADYDPPAPEWMATTVGDR